MQDLKHLRLIALIDGANFYDTMMKLGKKPDYEMIKKWLGEIADDYRIYYYTAVYEDDKGFSNLRSLLDWMEYRGIKVVQKPARTIAHDGRTFIKGNMDVEMTVDAMRMSDWADHIMLFTGDGDQTYLVEELQRRGKYVSVVSCLGANKKGEPVVPNFVADSLRRTANMFYDIPSQEFYKNAKN